MILRGKNIKLRLVEVSDAQFIYDMRTNESRAKYLSKVDGSVKTQEEWIKKYKIREKQKQEFYFIIESLSNNRLGLVRMYDFKNRSFSWGSWLIRESAPRFTAIESALQIYEFAFYKEGFINAHFEVQKDNEKVKEFHERFGAEIVSENDKEYFFNYKKEDYEKIKKKYVRFL